MADTRNTIRWDSVGVEKVRRDYADITADNNKTAQGSRSTGAAANQAAGSLNTLGNSTKSYAAHAEIASKSANGLGVGLAAMGRYASAATILELGRRTVLAADSFKTLQNQLRVAGFESEGLASATDRLFQISNRTKTSIEANATLYGRLASVQNELGASTDQLFTFTEAVGNALKVNNTEAGAAQGALLQLSQAMGGAKIQAQEFNSLIDGMRPLLQAAAKHIDGAGGSVSKLQQMVRDGELSNREFFEGALKGAQELENQAAKAQTNISQSIVVLRNNYIEAAGASDGFTAASSATAASIEWLGNNLDIIFKKVDDGTRPLTTMVGLVGDLGSKFGQIVDGEPAVESFFEAVGDAAYSALNPVGALAAQVGAIQEWLSSQGEWKVSVGRGWEGSRGAFSDKYGGAVPEPTDKPDLPDRIADQMAQDAEKAAKAQEDWQGRVADGWRDLYDDVGKTSGDFYTTLAEDVRKGSDADNDAYLERQKAIRGIIADVETETKMIGLTNAQRERAIGLMKLQAESANDLQVAQFNAVQDEKEIIQAAQDVADEVQAIWDKAADSFADSWQDMFVDIFDGGKFSFKKFTDSLRSMWANLMADLMMQSLKGSFIDPLFKGLTGGMAGQGGTGAAGTMGAFNSLMGKGGVYGDPSKAPGGMPGMPGAAGGTGGLLGSFGNVLGGAAMGSGIGKMVGSGTGGAIGGAMGAMAGLLVAGGPIGIIAGALLGGLLGGVMKPTPRSISSVTTSSVGLAGLGDSYALGLDPAIGQGAGRAVAKTLNEFADELNLSLDSDAFVGMVGQRGKKFFFQSQQGDIKKAGKASQGAVKFEEAEDAIAYAVQAALKNGIIDGLTDADKRLLEAATDVQQGMQDVIASHDFKKELHFQYIGLTNPLGEQLARLEDWYQDQLKLAEKYEADKTELEAVYARRRRDLIKAHNEQLYGGLKDFLTSITAGSASPLSPTTRLGLAQANYNTLRQKALAGDQDAIAALQGAASDYLGASQDVYASSGGFQSAYQQVVADLSSITGVTNPLGVGAASNGNVAAAVNDNTRNQALWSTQAANQRASTNAKLDTLIAQNAALVLALSRGSSAPGQNGPALVGTVDWGQVTQAIASVGR